MLKIRIEEGGTQPLYLKIAAAIRSEVQSGRLCPGDALPPIRVIAEQVGVSDMPVKQAVRMLVEEGLLVSTRGRGTFVRQRAEDLSDDGGAESGRGSRGKMVVLFQNGQMQDIAGYVAAFNERIEQGLGRIHFDVAHAPSNIEGCLRFLAAHGSDVAAVLAVHSGAGLLAARVPKPCGFPILGVVSPRESFDPTVLTDASALDSRGAIHVATSHLLGLGHRKIAFIHFDLRGFEPKFELDQEDRLAGFRQALSEGGVAFRDDYLVDGGLTLVQSKAAAQQLVELPERPTAIVCTNDVTAYGAMRAISEAGLRIPDDISVIGHYDLEMSQFTDPPLTSVGYEGDRDAATQVVQILIERLANPAKPPTSIVLNPELRVRASCAEAARLARA